MEDFLDDLDALAFLPLLDVFFLGVDSGAGSDSSSDDLSGTGAVRSVDLRLREEAELRDDIGWGRWEKLEIIKKKPRQSIQKVEKNDPRRHLLRQFIHTIQRVGRRRRDWLQFTTRSGVQGKGGVKLLSQVVIYPGVGLQGFLKDKRSAEDSWLNPNFLSRLGLAS